MKGWSAPSCFSVDEASARTHAPNLGRLNREFLVRGTLGPWLWRHGRELTVTPCPRPRAPRTQSGRGAVRTGKRRQTEARYTDPLPTFVPIGVQRDELKEGVNCLGLNATGDVGVRPGRLPAAPWELTAGWADRVTTPWGPACGSRPEARASSRCGRGDGPSQRTRINPRTQVPKGTGGVGN